MEEHNQCACGCGRPARRRYLPGHDAKHVANIYRLVQRGEISRRDGVKELPTRPLKNKLRSRLDRAA